MGLLAASLILTIALPARPRLVWNETASAPIGLYSVRAVVSISKGEMVLADMPAPWRVLADQRHYIPIDVPLIKRVAAAAGDKVCAFDDRITINDARAAKRHRKDRRGRLLPWWNGCRTVMSGDAFLLMDNPDSFDGRYFGITPGSMVLGKAGLLWAR
ncbi:S26 family signal peptidase [Novosphingobium rosa]|uniref:S26 family signal peptidase n=1 Tax=Novosphingobium rosa TaxID=76978 RepID=UPI000B2E2303|nr:S26 family signal peptidase [Novosphingobium rosa]